MVWVMTGFRWVCKTLLSGFDSLPYLQLYWPNKRWPLNSKGRNKLIDNLFFTRKRYTYYRKELKKKAFNKNYRPFVNPVNLCRVALAYERNRAERYKAEMIAARKELTRLRRERKK